MFVTMKAICTKCYAEKCMCLEKKGETELSVRWATESPKASEVTFIAQELKNGFKIPANFRYWVPHSASSGVLPGKVMKISNWVVNGMIKNINLKKLKGV